MSIILGLLSVNIVLQWLLTVSSFHCKVGISGRSMCWTLYCRR